MNHWPFIIASYGLTALGIAAVSWQAWRAARSAERQADELRRD